jgi:succinate-semialdehyde dehydrogenase / glutarate-semialdehyde dehydrogenase
VGWRTAAVMPTELLLDADLLREEIFGPVAPVVSFSSEEEEAIRWANGSEYGLVAYVYTRDLKRALRVEGLEFGMVGLNRGVVSNASAPFGA